jgi:hypothetical protein
MLKKSISTLLVFAVALVTVAPPRVFGQTITQPLAQPATSVIEPNLPAPPATPKPDLRKSLAAEVTKINTGPLTEADLKRLEREQQGQPSGAPPKSEWTRKNTIFLTLFIVVMTGVVWVAIKHRCKAPNPCPVTDSTDYSDN